MPSTTPFWMTLLCIERVCATVAPGSSETEMPSLAAVPPQLNASAGAEGEEGPPGERSGPAMSDSFIVFLCISGVLLLACLAACFCLCKAGKAGNEKKRRRRRSSKAELVEVVCVLMH